MFIRLFFESMWLLAVVWVPVQFLLIAVWSRRRSRLSARTVWVGFIALPLLLAVSSLVVTAREEIIATCGQLASFVEAPEVSAVERMLGDGFEAEGLDRDAFIERLERTLTRYRVWDVKLRRFEVTFPHRDIGIAEFHATARVRSAEMTHEWVTSRWRLTFRRAGNAWKLTGIKSSMAGARILSSAHVHRSAFPRPAGAH